MSMLPMDPEEKHCFTYCGDDWCTCSLAPRYNPPAEEPSRYHLTDVEPARFVTSTGTVMLGAGWLIISEQEYAELTRTRI